MRGNSVINEEEQCEKRIGPCLYTQVYNAYSDTAICDGWQYFFAFLGQMKMNLTHFIKSSMSWNDESEICIETEFLGQKLIAHCSFSSSRGSSHSFGAW